MAPKVLLLTAVLTIASFAATIPRKSPEFIITPPDGKQVTLSSYQGKVVCLLFILTTCPHCQQAVQSLNDIQKELGDKGFAVLVGTLNEDPDIPSFIQRFNPAFPVGEANKLAAFQYMQLSLKDRPPFVPYMVFIDRKGKIRSQYTGSDKILDGPESAKLLREEALKFVNENATSVKPRRPVQ